MACWVKVDVRKCYKNNINFLLCCTCALAMTSTSQMAVLQLTNETTASVNIAGKRPAWKKANGIPRNPVPSTKFTMKKNPRKMLTVFGVSALPALSFLHGRRSTKAVHIKRKDSMTRLDRITGNLRPTEYNIINVLCYFLFAYQAHTFTPQQRSIPQQQCSSAHTIHI